MVDVKTNLLLACWQTLRQVRGLLQAIYMMGRRKENDIFTAADREQK